MRRVVIALVGILLGAALFFLLRPHPAALDRMRGPASASTTPSGKPAAVAAKIQSWKTPANAMASPERSTLADALNAPSGTVLADLNIVHELLMGYQTNFHHQGNPVGNNAEITLALMGKNSLNLSIIPFDHPAINADGELCDRWGTPFRFHAMSGVQMEITSAGPDRQFGTADDAAFAPWSRAAVE